MIRATAVLPGSFHPEAFERNMLRQMAILVREIGRDFEETVSTWDDKPTWVDEVRATSEGVEGKWVTIAGDGRPATPEQIYLFVSRGTNVRYATMTNDFVPKTQPNVLVPGPGRGGLAFVSRFAPHVGIEARGWEQLIKRRRERRAQALLRKAMADGAKQSGHQFRTR